MGMKVNGTTGLTFPDTTTLASAGQASVRAWVNFNGTGTVAIRAAYNVTSITDNGTGDYTVNFTTAMPDANYSTIAPTVLLQGTGQLTTVINWARTPNTEVLPTTTAVRLSTISGTAGADATNVYVAIFR